MMWSAGMTIIAPSGSRFATIDAARPTHGAVSRAQGSATTLLAGISGNWSRISPAWSAPVMIRTRPGGTRGAIRATVCWIIVASPTRFSNCLGRCRRLLGQNLVPLPPAMMTAWSMGSPFPSEDLSREVVRSILDRIRGTEPNYSGLGRDESAFHEVCTMPFQDQQTGGRLAPRAEVRQPDDPAMRQTS